MNKLQEQIAPIELVDGYYLKRCDLLDYYGCKGGKANGAYNLIYDAMQNGYRKFVTVGSRLSPQCDIVSSLCETLNLTCDLFMPNGDSVVLNNIKNRQSSTLHQFGRGSYTNVLISYAKKFADENNAFFIPFGMVCKKNIDVISEQVVNIPNDVHRIVVPVGSGCTMAGIIQGLNRIKRYDVEVLGIITGSKDKSIKTVDKFTPKLFNRISYSFDEYISGIKPKYVYTTTVDAKIGDIKLDPIYEGKCYKFLEKGDMLWIVGYHDI